MRSTVLKGTLWCCAGLLLLSSCRDGRLAALVPPTLAVDPERLDFPRLAPGQQVALPLTVSNAGEVPLEISATLLEQAGPGFSLAPQPPRRLGQGQSFTLEVAFAPAAAGAYQGRVVFESSDPASPVRAVELSGTAQLQQAVEGEDGGPVGGDAGEPADPGTPDAGASDAGTWDAGTPPDAGQRCLDRPEGTVRWEYPAASTLGGYLFSSPALGEDGTIYFGTSSGALVALWPDGSEKWKVQTAGNALVATAPAIGPTGTIYFGSYDLNLHAVSPAGALLWSFPTGGPVNSSPAIGAGGIVYFGSGDGHLYAVDPAGTQQWAFDAQAYVYSSPAVGADGAVYFGTKYPGKLVALNSNGSLRWSFPIGSDVDSSPALGPDGTIYVGADNGVLYALHPNGTLKWQQSAGGGGLGGNDSSPALAANGTVSLGSWSGRVDAVSATGAPAWSYATGSAVGWSSPTIGADGVQYIATKDAHTQGANNRLLALGAGGILKWDLVLPAFLDTSPALASDGTLYVGAWNGKLYAVCSHSPGLAASSWPKFRRDAQNTGRLASCPGCP